MESRRTAAFVRAFHQPKDARSKPSSPCRSGVGRGLDLDTQALQGLWEQDVFLELIFLVSDSRASPASTGKVDWAMISLKSMPLSTLY